MNQPNFVKRGIYTVMGVKDPTQDTTIQTNLGNPQWDRVATLRYLGATIAQVAMLTGLLWSMDGLFSLINTNALPHSVVVAIACLFFAFVTLRSRFFSLLDNTRNNGRYLSIERPGWAPPPLAFPIVWMSIAVLRVVSAYLVWSTLGQAFLCLPLMLFMVHLSLGDTWNTIFTVEGRLGTAVPMVIIGPLLSAVVVTISYC
jgi:tryptophan-rich sensory protein